MNWMIDGVYGDQYRTAMGYQTLTPHDEWEVERQMAKKPSQLGRAQAAMRKFWAIGRAALRLPGTRVAVTERIAS